MSGQGGTPQTPKDLVQSYLDRGFKICYWPAIGDIKGPTFEGWPRANYPIEDFVEGYRVGLLTGVEIAPGKHLVDIDVDWAPGAVIAQAFLPPSDFIYGRPSKRVSHIYYTTSIALPTIQFRDIGKKENAGMLIELRGTRTDGAVGLHPMAPPSIWRRGEQQEPLQFVRNSLPSHIEDASALIDRVVLAAIGMLLAKYLGENGFGHDARLAWAGMLLREGVAPADLITMGEAMSAACNNREVADVRRVVESTASAMEKGDKKTKGAPALAKILGPDVGKAVIARIREWLGTEADFERDRSKKGQPIIANHQDNIARALSRLDVELRYNLFADKVLVTYERATQVFDDALMQRLWLRIDREFRFRPTLEFFEIVIRSLASENAFHPVLDYLEGLSWDGTPRLDEWLITHGGADDTEYTRHVSAIVLIAAVKRVRHPGCKYDEMLVLESGQGMNKSSAIQALCPDPGWFSDDLPLNVDAKQIIERTVGKWVIEASDLAGKRKADVEHLKSMLSRQVDGPARLAYARLSVERPRQFILIGTTNSAAYLADSTGARRYWPVRVQGFRLPELKAVRDQLWAEAAHREKLGESIRLHEALWPAAGVEQERRQSADAWEEIIRHLLLETEPASDGRRRVITNDIWAALGIEVARRDRVGALRISEIMQKFGVSSRASRGGGGGGARGYGMDDPGSVRLLLVSDDDVEVAAGAPPRGGGDF